MSLGPRTTVLSPIPLSRSTAIDSQIVPDAPKVIPYNLRECPLSILTRTLNPQTCPTIPLPQPLTSSKLLSPQSPTSAPISHTCQSPTLIFAPVVTGFLVCVLLESDVATHQVRS